MGECEVLKDTLWDFSDKCCLSFSLLKNAFTTALVLTHWRPDLPIIVETDASDYALVAILSIQKPMEIVRGQHAS